MLRTLGVRLVFVGNDLNGEATYDVVLRGGEDETVESAVPISRLLQGAQVIAAVPVLKREPPPSRKVIKRVSQAQEQRVATEIGGRRQTGSGARPGFKGDGRVPGKYRIENKHTYARSLRVTLEDLQKIRGECEGLETPLFQVEFVDRRDFKILDKWVLMPWKQAKELINELPDADDDR